MKVDRVSVRVCWLFWLFFADEEPDIELVKNKPSGFVIMLPQNKAWAELIETGYPSSRKVTRYAIKKDTRFDIKALKRNLQMLPDSYELKPIDDNIFDMCPGSPVANDFVSVFESKEKYLKKGRGVVILQDGKIVSGASSYTRYRCSALVIRCLEEGSYPSWDAHNMGSEHLAEKPGYEFDHEYAAYEVALN